MSRTRTTAPDRAEEGKQRKATAPKARTPEPKEIISGAGQPLDAGLRRELEARLGHDFSRVRVHTDRDSAALTDLLGADAVTVGEDIFFAEGRFRPGTDDGRRLVAHELLHTVQSPHALGTLRAGRDLGAVSLPQDAIEREAERGARSPGQRPEVTRDATPGWLRYARVRADQFRTEQLDPATLVDRLTAGILRSLRGDPTDAAGRVRSQLACFSDELRSSVLDRLSHRLPSGDYARMLELLHESAQGPAGKDTGKAPEPVVDPAKPAEKENGPGQEAGDKGEQAKEPKDQPPKEEKPKEEAPQDRQKDKQGDKPKDKQKDKPKDEAEKKAEEEKDGKPQDKDAEEPEDSEDSKDSKDKPAAEQGKQPPPAGSAAAEAPAAAPEAAAPAQAMQEPGAPGQQREQAQQGPAQGSKPQDVDQRQAAQPQAPRPDQVDKLAEAKDSPLTQHGLNDGEKGDVREEERPLGLESDADKEVDTPKDEEPAPEPPAETPLKPDDFLPGSDLDVSSVPTADRLTVPASGGPPPVPEAPSLPEPPRTKAEEVQRQRESAPDEEAQEPAPGPAEPGAAPEAQQEEADTEAESGPARDLRADKPVEQEVGPDPETAQSAGTGPREPDNRPEPAASVTDSRAAEAAEPGTDTDVAADRGNASSTAAGPEGTASPQTGVRPGGSPGADGGPGAAGPLGGAEPEAADRPLGPAAEQAEAPGALGAPGAQPGQEASMEAGGGGCAGAPQPATEEGAGAGGCGGGGEGGQAKEAEKPAPPDVSGQDPQSALATAATLPPDQMVTTLDGVDGAVDRSVGEEHAALEANAPTAQRPSGAPRTLSGPPREADPAQQVTEHVEREGAESGKDQKKVEGDKTQDQNPAAQVERPNVSDDSTNKVSAEEVQNMQNAVGDVPDRDPSLNKKVRAPKVEYSGESDPKRTDKQAENLKKSSDKILAVGREDSAKPMGEDQIYPDVPGETLKGDVPGGSGGGQGRAKAKAGAKPGVAVVAQQERGPEIQASVGQAQGRMTSEQAKREQSEAEERARSQEEQDKAVAENAEAQAGERGQAAEQVKAERAQWQTEQDGKITQADTDAAKEHDDKNQEIDKKRTDTDQDVGKRQDEDNKKIQDNRKEAEEKARKEKEAKKEESSGWFGWVKSKVKAAFDALISVVTGIFDFFRKIVNGIIEKFREFANWAIEQARKFAVELIKKLADALIAIGDVLLAAFPELRDKFRNKIKQWRDQAIAKVNEWADRLKEAVNKLLDLLAAGLNKLLDLLEKGLKAAIEMARSAVMAAIDFAEKAIAMLGQFAALVVDIAADPGGWLKKLGTAAKEGIQHHLWGAVKQAVKVWFNEKVESVLGLGRMLINVLIKGCISMAQIGRMAWEALVQSLPGIIISIVIEKVVSMIIPAAGAIMTIIQGLMAAWGTISKIIAAFGKFFAFLKAVKSGAAACLFAQAVAAGVVALLEFITNFLLSRLKMASKGVGTKLKAMAQKIMKGLKKAAKGARKAAGGAINRARAGLKKATQALRPKRPPRSRPTRPPRGRPAARSPKGTRPKRPASAPVRAAQAAKNQVKGALKQVGNAARTLGRKLKNSKLGRALTNGARKVRDAFKRQRDKLRDRYNKWKQKRAERRKRENSPEGKKERLALIISRIRPRIQKLLSRGIPRQLLRGALAGMRVWYGLSALSVRGTDRFGIEAVLNPEDLVLSGLKVKIPRREVLEFLNKVARDIENDPAIVRASGHVQVAQKAEGVVPRHTVSQPVPPPAITRLTRDVPPLKKQEQDALDFMDQGSLASLRRTQAGERTPNKVVVGEGFTADEQLSHIYLSKKVKGVKKAGIAEEFTQNKQWDGFSAFADNFFRGKPQLKDIPKKERTDMLKTAWLLGGQEVERDPQAIVTNALTVQRLVKANEEKRGSAAMEKVFKSLPAAFSGSESGGEWLTEDLNGTRSIEAERARVNAQRAAELEQLKKMRADPGVSKQQVDDFARESKNKRAREMRPIKNADKLGDRHVQSVAAWMKDFGVEKKVEAMIDGLNLETTDQYEAKVKELVFRMVREAVVDMYTAAHR
ncbi:eCIS core domain-containing protein [Wenjunlia tyrosinilytica]|uniref:eCIS core domain-containing protein n=1 Tax=Wenjunlia tyrosinilytica TaxID=1544741 RepID=A0A918DZB9_9ACTN|nr:DUF4157 domain-containing protein [Wenjunlia tyrosinilytica]GGO94893.1 hypothetical protein GCM10012280_50850 [Wenjunlia tyrosinilytica]